MHLTLLECTTVKGRSVYLYDHPSVRHTCEPGLVAYAVQKTILHGHITKRSFYFLDTKFHSLEFRGFTLSKEKNFTNSLQ